MKDILNDESLFFANATGRLVFIRPDYIGEAGEVAASHAVVIGGDEPPASLDGRSTHCGPANRRRNGCRPSTLWTGSMRPPPNGSGAIGEDAPSSSDVPRKGARAR